MITQFQYPLETNLHEQKGKTGLILLLVVTAVIATGIYFVSKNNIEINQSKKIE